MTSGLPSPDDPEQLKTAIEQTRDELGRTLEQLVAKTDVKARAQAKASELSRRAKDATTQVRRQGVEGARTYRTPLIIAVGALIAGAVVVGIWRRR
jgi:hypothetical protein